MTTAANPVWNEESTLFVRVAFFNEDDVPVIPDEAFYTLRDVHTGDTIIDWTAFPAPPAATQDLVFAAADMAIRETRRALEAHELTVRFTWNSGARQAYDRYLFDVRNLQAAPQP
jgi:hypothetical protein